MYVENIMKSLKNSYSAGFDEIPEVIVKTSVHYIKKPLTHIFDLSLQKGLFPDSLKVAKTRPVFKKGEKSVITNYRPISILPVFSKILGKLMYKRLISYIDTFNILAPEQHGFRKYKSTHTAVHSFVEHIQEALDKQQYVIGICLDLTRVYDVVNHSILLDKLEFYGIRGPGKAWFESCLSN
jgi:hypothetical protein